MYPHDIQITQRQKNILTDAAPEALLAQAESAAAGEGRTLRHESYIIHSRVYWTLSGDTFRFGDQQEGAEYTVSLMTAAEYSRLTGRAVSLAPDEMLVYTSEGTVPETFRIESTPYRVAGTLDTFQGESRAMISNIPNAGFVVADDSVLSVSYTHLDVYKRQGRHHIKRHAETLGQHRHAQRADLVGGIAVGRHPVTAYEHRVDQPFFHHGGRHIVADQRGVDDGRGQLETGRCV